MTLPVPNTNQRLVDKLGKILNPWNLWFQSFSQPPQASQDVTVGVSPFDYKPNNVGTLYITGGTVSDVSVIRGIVTIALGNINRVTVSIGDTIRITYSVLPTIRFWEL